MSGFSIIPGEVVARLVFGPSDWLRRFVKLRNVCAKRSELTFITLRSESPISAIVFSNICYCTVAVNVRLFACMLGFAVLHVQFRCLVAQYPVHREYA